MKKLAFIMLALTFVGSILTGCKKSQNNDNPTPTTTEYTVGYVIWGTEVAAYSPCFKFNLAYTDANGQTVTKENVSAPWNTTITVKAPFTGKIEGTIIFNEDELPAEHVVFPRSVAATGFGKGANIGFSSLNIHSEISLTTYKTKERFLQKVAENPDMLKFSATVEIQ